MDKELLTGNLKNLEREFGTETVQNAINAVEQFRVEVPSWVFGEFGGGRFGDYMPPGFATNIIEKLDDAAMVNQLTGASDQIATHTLWDFSEDGLEGSYDKAVDVK